MSLARITEWDLVKRKAVTGGQAVDLQVDFDPQSLELSYRVTGPAAAEEATPATPKNKTPAQNTGQSSSLSVTLVFDTTTSNGVSVQTRTDPLVLLTVPRPGDGTSPGNPRVVRFHWGSFLYFGTVSSLSQTIDMFSDDGVPLRATVRLSLTQVSAPGQPAAAPGGGAPTGVGFGVSAGLTGGVTAGATATAGFGGAAGFSAGVSGSLDAGLGIGTTPLTLSHAGDTVQAIAARAGGSVSWKAVAAANNIDNPRLLPAGTVLSASAGAGLTGTAR